MFGHSRAPRPMIGPTRASVRLPVRRRFAPAGAEPALVDHPRLLTIQTCLLVAIAALCAFHVAVLAYHLAHVITFPYDLDYGEGYVLNDAIRLQAGQLPYGDIQQFPMVRSPYPPIFPLIWS